MVGRVGVLLEHQRGQPIASPALLGEITQTFVAQVEAFAKQESIPIVHFQKGQRKDDVAAGYRRKFTKAEGVVFIGVAQEKMSGWKARKETQGKVVRFQFSQQSVFVRHYYSICRIGNSDRPSSRSERMHPIRSKSM